MLAAVPEDDLPALHDLMTRTRNHIAWTVRTVGRQAHRTAWSTTSAT